MANLEFIVGVIAAQLLLDGHPTFLRETKWGNIVLGGGPFLDCDAGASRIPLSDVVRGLIERQFRLDVMRASLPISAAIVALAAGQTFLSPASCEKRDSYCSERPKFRLVHLLNWFLCLLLEYRKTAGHAPSAWEVSLGIAAMVWLFPFLSFKYYETPLRNFLRGFFQGQP